MDLTDQMEVIKINTIQCKAYYYIPNAQGERLKELNLTTAQLNKLFGQSCQTIKPPWVL